MTQRRGERSRPRILIDGELEPIELERLQQLVPAASISVDGEGLEEHADEVDVLILLNGANATGDRPHLKKHEIAIGRVETYPRYPHIHRPYIVHDRAKRRGFDLASIHPTLDVIRRDDFRDRTDARGMALVSGGNGEAAVSTEELVDGALALTTGPSPRPLASVTWRASTDSGLAVIPWDTVRRVEWIVAIIELWAGQDRAAFADIEPWHNHPEWMTHEERELVGARARLDEEERRIIQQLAARRSELAGNLTLARAAGDRGIRRLLTETGDELVTAIAAAFEGLGLVVEPRDVPGRPKREDLRVRQSEVVEWEAVVEIKGYGASGGGLADINKLANHVVAYVCETGGRAPSARWLVLNGQYKLPPARRAQPFASEAPVIEEFASHDGLVVPTVDLFRALTTADPADVRKALIEGRGVFRWPPAAT